MAIDPGTTLILITCLICTIVLAFAGKETGDKTDTRHDQDQNHHSHQHHPIAPARHRMRNANSQPGIRRTADENTDTDENGKEAGART